MSLGGIPRHVSQLLSSLAPELRIVNLVASPDRHSRVRRGDRYAIVEAACHGLLAGTAVAPAMLPIAHRLVRRMQAAIVHLHFPDPLALLVAETLPRRIPLVVTWHSDVVRQSGALRWYQPLVERLLRRVPAVIASTRAQFEGSTQLGVLRADQGRVIPFGVDLAALDNPASRAAGAELRRRLGPEPIVLGAGRHVYYKGFDVLIDAMRQLPQARLVLCGQGELTATLREHAARSGMAERVVFTGKVSDAQLAAWYQACDVFCMPSVERAETFGLVQLEAMACGKPVVVTQLGNGVNEVHVDGETGYAVPVRDAQALANAVGALLADPSLRVRMGEAGRARARDCYGIDRMRDATLALYREILERD